MEFRSKVVADGGLQLPVSPGVGKIVQSDVNGNLSLVGQPASPYQVHSWNALTGTWQADENVYTPFAARALSAQNNFVDPRGVATSRFTTWLGISPPSAPALSTAASGGTIAAGQYIVQISYVTALGETLPSVQQVITTSGAASTITITSPAARTNATGWYAYVSQVGGTSLTRQQAAGSPTAIGTNLTITAPPTSTGVLPQIVNTGGQGSSAITQNPTNRVDGFQQNASPQSCIEVVATVQAGGYLALATNSNSVTCRYNIFQAVRAAAKVTLGAAGNWYAALVMVYYGPGTAPAGTFTATPVAGGSMGVGAYLYQITFVDQTGAETAPSAEVSATTTSSNKTVNLAAIPLGPTGTVQRRIYRTSVGGATKSERLLAVIANNTATTYSDTAADAAITGIPAGQNGGRQGECVVWTSTNQTTADSTALSAYLNGTNQNGWFATEGFDNQTPTTSTTFYELELRIYNTSGSTETVTLKGTEWCQIPDPEGDVPSYVGGDVSASQRGAVAAYTDYAWGNWYNNGTPDSSNSIVLWDPVHAYPSADEFGFNNYSTVTAYIGREETIKYFKEMGCTVSREDGLVFNGVAGPAAPTLALVATSVGNLGSGLYRYQVTFVTSGVETTGGTEASITTDGTHKQVTVSNIPIGPSGTTARKIYRTAVGGAIGTEKLCITISDNTTTSTTDNVGDASLTTVVPVVIGTLSSDKLAWLNQLIAGGIKPILAVGVPNWMYQGGTWPSPYGWPTQTNYQQAFANAIVALIGQLGAANVWGVQVANEPNNSTYGGSSGATDPTSFSTFMTTVYNIVNAAYPSVRMLGGVLSAATVTGGATDAASYLQGMYTAGCKYDVLDIHPYPVQHKVTQSGVNYYAGTSAPGHPAWTQVGAFNQGFDASLKAIKDVMQANAAPGGSAPDTRSIFISECGQLSADERVQGQVGALLYGRSRRDPKILGLLFNGVLDALSINADWSSMDPKTMRRRFASRQLAKINGRMSPFYLENEVVRYDGGRFASASWGAPSTLVAMQGLATEIQVGSVGNFPIIFMGGQRPNDYQVQIMQVQGGLWITRQNTAAPQPLMQLRPTGSDTDASTKLLSGVNHSAAETFYVRADGYNVQTVAVEAKITLAYSASITPDASLGPWQTITVTNTTAFTINAPINPPSSSQSQELTIEVLNSSGGTMGLITWNAAFIGPAWATPGAWANPASTKKRYITFRWNGVNWIRREMSLVDY